MHLFYYFTSNNKFVYKIIVKEKPWQLRKRISGGEKVIERERTGIHVLRHLNPIT